MPDAVGNYQRFLLDIGLFAEVTRDIAEVLPAKVIQNGRQMGRQELGEAHLFH